MADNKANDVTLIQAELSAIEEQAPTLRWYKERPWRAQTHVWFESGMPVVDLHDLNMRLARQTVRATLTTHSELHCGAVCFITGRGRHSVGPPALRGMVAAELQKACDQHSEWQHRPGHAGRWMWVFDASRAPRVATGQLGPLFWLMVVLFIGLAIWALVGLPGQTVR